MNLHEHYSSLHLHLGEGAVLDYKSTLVHNCCLRKISLYSNKLIQKILLTMISESHFKFEGTFVFSQYISCHSSD